MGKGQRGRQLVRESVKKRSKFGYPGDGGKTSMTHNPRHKGGGNAHPRRGPIGGILRGR